MTGLGSLSRVAGVVRLTFTGLNLYVECGYRGPAAERKKGETVGDVPYIISFFLTD
jgi:hypothetical protein